MEYPKPVMGATELRQMGFPRSVVDRAARSKGQRFCWRSNPKNPRSPLLFDTEGFEKWRQSQARLLELEVPEEKIVVAKISTGSRILELFGAGLKTALRILGILAVFILASIGLTVLCNSYLRTTFFDAIAATFF